jgi:hypothetical protein
MAELAVEKLQASSYRGQLCPCEHNIGRPLMKWSQKNIEKQGRWQKGEE